MTLTQTAALTKKAMWAFVAFILTCAIVFVSYQIYYNYYYLPHLPKKIELPDTKFGLLPEPNLPIATESASSSAYTYTLDTQTGSLPTNLPKIIKVFFVPQLGTTLLAPDRVQNLATQLGFLNGPEVVGDTQYHFTDQNGGKLNIDLNSGNFSFDRPATDSATLSDQTLGDQNEIISDFKSYLSNNGLASDQLGGKSLVTYDQGSADQSDQADVSLWPSDLDSGKGNLPVVTPAFDKALVNATITKSSLENYHYIHMRYIFWTPDVSSASTYPLKSVNQAFQELQDGDGFISQPPISNNASITQVYLAYLETENYSPYIQPVYVFQGPNFTAYVPAIAPNYVAK